MGFADNRVCFKGSLDVFLQPIVAYSGKLTGILTLLSCKRPSLEQRWKKNNAGYVNLLMWGKALHLHS
jgi:hypothetical protein